MSMSQQCVLMVKAANHLLDKWSKVAGGGKCLLLRILPMTLHLQQYVQFGAPKYKTDIDLLE